MSTIEKCFLNSGFSMLFNPTSDTLQSETSDLSVVPASVVASVVHELDADDYPLSIHKLSFELFDCELKDLIEVDAMFDTCDNDMSKWDKTANELLKTESSDDEGEIENGDRDVDPTVCPPITINDASDCLERLSEFAFQQGNDMMCNFVMSMEDLMVNMRTSKTVKVESYL